MVRVKIVGRAVGRVPLKVGQRRRAVELFAVQHNEIFPVHVPGSNLNGVPVERRGPYGFGRRPVHDDTIQPGQCCEVTHGGGRPAVVLHQAAGFVEGKLPMLPR